MTQRRFDGFFYGLFMDADVLTDAGVSSVNPRSALVDDYCLMLGNRATLWPAAGQRAYGMIFSLTRSEISTLYSAEGLEVYQPEAVSAVTLDHAVVTPCLCYNLPQAPHKHERNSAYAAKLKIALRKLNFPTAYIESIQ